MGHDPKPATVSFGDDLLTLNIKTPFPPATLFRIILGINVAMRESLFAESLTPEDKEGLAALQQFAIDILHDPPNSKAVA